MAGIALKDQVDLISTVAPLEVLVQQLEMRKKKIGRSYFFSVENTIYKTKQIWRDDEDS